MSAIPATPPPTPFERSAKLRQASIFLALGCLLVERLAYLLTTNFLFSLQWNNDEFEFMDGSVPDFRIIGLFFGLSSLLPIPFSIVSDRVMERRKAMLAGLGLEAIGLICLNFPFLYGRVMGLGMVAVGGAVFFPAVIAYIAQIFPRPILNKDRAFTLSIGLNYLVSFVISLPFFSPFQSSSWSFFIVALVLATLVVLSLFVKGPFELAPEPTLAGAPLVRRTQWVGLLIMGFSSFLFTGLLFSYDLLELILIDTYLLPILRFLLLISALVYILFHLTKSAKAMLGVSMAFFLTMTFGLAAEGSTNSYYVWFNGLEVESLPWLTAQMVQGFIVVVLAAVLFGVYGLFKNRELHSTLSIGKIALGFFLSLIGFVLMVTWGREGEPGLFNVAIVMFFMAAGYILIFPSALGLNWHFTPPLYRSLSAASITSALTFGVMIRYDFRILEFYETLVGNPDALGTGDFIVVVAILGLSLFLAAGLTLYFFNKRIRA